MTLCCPQALGSVWPGQWERGPTHFPLRLLRCLRSEHRVPVPVLATVSGRANAGSPSLAGGHSVLGGPARFHRSGPVPPREVSWASRRLTGTGPGDCLSAEDTWLWLGPSDVKQPSRVERAQGTMPSPALFTGGERRWSGRLNATSREMKGTLTPSGTLLSVDTGSPPTTLFLAELKWIQGPHVQPASCLFLFHEKDPVPRSKAVWENALDSRLREAVREGRCSNLKKEKPALCGGAKGQPQVRRRWSHCHSTGRS